MANANSPIKAGDTWRYTAANGARFTAQAVLQGPARNLRIVWTHKGREVVRQSAPLPRRRYNANAALDGWLDRANNSMAGPI